MTQWRRALKSWPKETPETADSSSLPAWVVEAGRERSETPKAKRTRRRLKLFCSFILVPWILIAAVLPSGPLSWGLLASGTVVVFLSLFLSNRVRDRASAQRRDRALERADLIGEPTLGAEYVGADYADAAWRYPGLGESADEGFLRLEMDRLTFVGHDTRFELPAYAILGTELHRYESGLGVRVRLLVRWAYGGEAGTVGLSLPFGRSLRRRVQDAVDLRERIERWRGEPFPRLAMPAVLPPTITPVKKAEILVRVGLPAKAISATVLLAAFVVSFTMIQVVLILAGHREFARDIGGSVAAMIVPIMAVWIALAAKIEPRLPERWRYREPEAAPLPDLGGAREVDGVEIRIRD